MPVAKRYTRAQRKPRKAKPCVGTREGWYYVDHQYIEVLARTENTGVHFTTAVRLTRKQLERALEIMDGA